MKASLVTSMLVLIAARAALGADIVNQPTLTVDGAKRVAAAAVAYARSHDAPGASIAVVDAGGHTIYVERLDGTFSAGSDISIGKARTAVVFKRPTRGIEEGINKGRTAMVDVASVTWFTPLQGGVPIISGGQIVGGVGVSGAAGAQQDEEVALAGAAAIGAPAIASQVTHVPAAAVAKSFSVGATGATIASGPGYSVNASRRDGPGRAEVHVADTDVLYVLEGSATVVTGGQIVAPHEESAREIRGTAIEGGTDNRIQKGDVLTIPNGVPHWFKVVKAPFRYYVIKATDDPAAPPVAAAPASAGTPAAVIDLTTEAGAAAVRGTWRYSDAKIVETAFRAPDGAGQPTGPEWTTNDIVPHAGVAGFDDSKWASIAPSTLSARRGTGRVSFNWYRINITIPDKVSGFDPTGSSVWFETRLDDYAEVWVDGEIGRQYGQNGGSVVAGWNAPNRLLIARNAHPGQHIQIAVFGMNGPISDAPTNYIYVREAKLTFSAGAEAPVAVPPHEVNVVVERKDAAIDAIVPANAKLFKIAEGFQFTEGPVWLRDRRALLFSDPNHNTIYQYADDHPLAVFRDKSGYDAPDIGDYGQPGSNGLTLDARGRLTINEHGRHRVSRLERNGSLTVLADSFEGKRLNSPNDLVYRSDGSLYFTDPPFGLPKFFDDPRKELPYSGIFRWKSGRLQLLNRDLKGPNGIVFSPDEKYLYVSNWDPAAKTVTRYSVQSDGSLDRGEVFIDLTQQIPGDEALDGMKADIKGNLYLSAPGGVWIFDANGKHLGTITAPRPVHNFAWGGDDGRTLYLCASSALYRIDLKIPGIRP